MTRLIVLGLLERQPMSGYDIQQMIREGDAERWGGVLVGSIYHALKKLEQEKQIELADVKRTGHRQKAVYQITDRGRDYLQSLIIESLSVSSIQYPTTLYSGLCFLNKIPLEEAKGALKKQKELLDQEYRSLERGRKSNEYSGEEISVISQITIDNMFAIVRQQQQFVDTILGALEEDMNDN